MITFHIFNPEHDISLAHNKAVATAPHAARELRANLGFLPALWAKNGDIVIVDDHDFACKAAEKCGVTTADVLFLDKDEVRRLMRNFSEGSYVAVDVWGWDRAVCKQLEDMGFDKQLLPDDNKIETIRQLSGRHTSVGLLREMKRLLASHDDGTFSDSVVGDSFIETSITEVRKRIGELGRAVLKSPWSSSGRGVRYVDNSVTTSQEGWISNTLRQQGALIVEPFYNKVCDFGMEFVALPNGDVTYSGLSLFSTEHGAYIGNIVDQENNKLEALMKLLPEKLLIATRRLAETTLKEIIGGRYVGPLGIDMMVVTHEDGEKFCLHPCVELNLRRTMGHVALALTPKRGEPRKLMSIVHNVNYMLRLSNLDNNFVMTV